MFQGLCCCQIFDENVFCWVCFCRLKTLNLSKARNMLWQQGLNEFIWMKFLAVKKVYNFANTINSYNGNPVYLNRILYQLLLQEVNTNWYAISSLDISNELSLFSFLLVPTIFNSVAKGWLYCFRSFWSANIHFLLAKTSANIV